jgi:pyruvate/2-oxoglutarate dehydrogenase complex dihydrolipoamide acyltransferase (E2) component
MPRPTTTLLLPFLVALLSAPGLDAAPRSRAGAVSKEEQAACRARCAAAGRAKVPAKGGCEDYREMRPFPQLMQICEDSYKGGAVYGCELGCADSPLCHGLGNNVEFGRGRDKGCAQYDAMLPRPTMANACRAGFTRGAEATCADSILWVADAAKRAEEAAARARAEEEAASLAEQEARLTRQRAEAENRRRAVAEAAERSAREKREREEEEARVREEEDAKRRGRTRGMGK